MEEFVNLFIDRLLPFWGEAPSFLFDRSEGGADVQLVCDYCGVNSSHILLLLGKYVYIMFQEVSKGVPNVFGQSRSDVDEILQMVVELYRF